MWRGGAIGGGIFLAVALLWAVLDPLLAWRDVRRLGQPASDLAAAEGALLARGRASLRPLRQGLESADGPARLRCARLLGLLGETAGDEVLLKALRQDRDQPEGALAEHLLLSLWDRRRGPDEPGAARALGAESEEALSEGTPALDLLLNEHPAWVGGHVARARAQLLRKEPRLALRDVLSALLLEPHDFEAMVLLARAYRQLGYPEQALDCLERALQTCPRLQRELAEELDGVRAAARAERERRLRERRTELPVI